MTELIVYLARAAILFLLSPPCNIIVRGKHLEETELRGKHIVFSGISVRNVVFTIAYYNLLKFNSSVLIL